MSRSCYICKGKEFKLRPGKVRDNSNLQILECKSCGLVTLSSHEHIAAKHYENSGMYGGNPPTIEFRKKNAEVNDKRRFEMLEPILVNRSVLDFGCGAAGFLLKAKAVAQKVTGVEPDRYFWNESLDFYPDIQSVELTEMKYDLVTAFHVFEHLRDPLVHLKSLGDVLADKRTSDYRSPKC
jgi:2-polyprenyl-3-methyl-5-hydroxy-6-metoxy-1,4-benzoquinol methylase